MILGVERSPAELAGEARNRPDC